MEGTDDMEHVLLERIGNGLVLKAGIVVVEHALFARAGGTDVAAGVAADAARQFAAPEGVALLCRHGLEFFNLGKTAAVRIFLALRTEQLVEADEFLLLQVLHLSSSASAFLIVRSP